MTRDEMTRDEMTRDEMTGDETTRSPQNHISMHQKVQKTLFCDVIKVENLNENCLSFFASVSQNPR
jgi:hypothetical protein